MIQSGVLNDSVGSEALISPLISHSQCGECIIIWLVLLQKQFTIVIFVKLSTTEASFNTEFIKVACRLVTNIRLECKCLESSNTLAYSSRSISNTQKSFITFAKDCRAVGPRGKSPESRCSRTGKLEHFAS